MYQFRRVSHYITSNCIRIDRQYSPYPVPMMFWLLWALIINQAHLTHFAPCWLATLLFQVFHIPFSDNDIGLHTMWIFITPRFMVLDSGRYVHLITFHYVKIMYICTCFLHISVPMNPVLFNPIDYDTIFNLCTVFLYLRVVFCEN